MKLLNKIIVLLLFLLLPVDAIHGFFLHSGINLPLSLGQFYKLGIIFLLFLSFVTQPNKLFLTSILLLLLLIPSIVQVFIQLEFGFLFNDFIKITKYLTPVFAFLFFVNYIKKEGDIDLLFKLVKFSFFFFSFNILIKYAGFGYPMYNYGDVGSKGFFYAGNETSVVLIILSSIIAYRLWLKRKIKKYFLFFLFSLFIGFTISSKTGMLGIILTFILIPIRINHFKLTPKKLIGGLFFLFFLVPILIRGMISLVRKSDGFGRLEYFWEKLDFVTFVFSNRNNFFTEALNIYIEKYNFIEKIIGVGQAQYEAQYEILNGTLIVEIDIADIFFAYGFIGLILFVSLISFIWYQAKKFKSTGWHPYASFVGLMVLILLGISTIAGHVFSSGMAAIFIGLLFSLMYIKKDTIEN